MNKKKRLPRFVEFFCADRKLTGAEWSSSTPESIGLAGSDSVSLQLITFDAGVRCLSSELSAGGHDVAVLRWLKVAASGN